MLPFVAISPRGFRLFYRILQWKSNCYHSTKGRKPLSHSVVAGTCNLGASRHLVDGSQGGAAVGWKEQRVLRFLEQISRYPFWPNRMQVLEQVSFKSMSSRFGNTTGMSMNKPACDSYHLRSSNAASQSMQQPGSNKSRFPSVCTSVSGRFSLADTCL